MPTSSGWKYIESSKMGTTKSPHWKGHQFRGLATLIDAGIAPVQAVDTLRRQDDAAAAALAPVLGELKSGASLADAFSKTRLLARHEIEIIRVAEYSGKLPGALKFIATGYETRQRRLKKLKSQLWLPFAVFIVALVAGLALNVYGRHQTAARALFESLVYLAIVIAMTRSMLSLLRVDALRWVSICWSLGLKHRITLCQRIFEQYWYTLLMWQIDAGIDYRSALGQIKDLLPSRAYQSSVHKCMRNMRLGQNLTTALTQAGLVFSEELRLVLEVGEQSGRLVDSVRDRLVIQQQQLNLVAESYYEWIPRFYYALIVVVGGSVLIPRA
jgi:type II secretory pathway component PulF